MLKTTANNKSPLDLSIFSKVHFYSNLEAYVQQCTYLYLHLQSIHKHASGFSNISYFLSKFITCSQHINGMH